MLKLILLSSCHLYRVSRALWCPSLSESLVICVNNLVTLTKIIQSLFSVPSFDSSLCVMVLVETRSGAISVVGMFLGMSDFFPISVM